MLTALRILNIVIWLVVLAFMLPSAWSVIRDKGVRRGDPMRLSTAAVCLLIILGNLRFLFAPDREDLFRAIYLFSALIGGYKLILARAYGRGPKL